MSILPVTDSEKLEAAADKVFNRCNYFNDYVLETIGRRMKAVKQLSAHDQQALKNIADITGDMEAITKRLAEITELNVQEIEEIYTSVITDSVNSYKPLFDFKGIKFVPFKDNEYAQMLVKHWYTQTVGEMINLSRTKALCFNQYNLAGKITGTIPLEGAYQKAIDDAVIALSTGTTDLNTAIRETVVNLGGSGVKVDYGSGVSRSLSAMVRQNLLYGSKQSIIAYDDYINNQIGCDGFEVDAHPGCRPTHEFMQGKMYSYKGPVTIKGITYEDGTEALMRLNDYGCLHYKTGVILGVSEPRYSEEDLSDIRKQTTELIEYNGESKTLYKWKQVQRRLERDIRQQYSIQHIAEAADEKSIIQECKEKITAYRNTYDELCDKTGLNKRYSRMAAYAGKTVDKIEESGIIEARNGLKIGGLSSHAMKRVAERGVKISAIEDALKNPLIIKEPVVDMYGRKSQRFVGINATVNVNPETGKIITTWKTGKTTIKKYRKE